MKRFVHKKLSCIFINKKVIRKHHSQKDLGVDDLDGAGLLMGTDGLTEIPF